MDEKYQLFGGPLHGVNLPLHWVPDHNQRFIIPIDPQILVNGTFSQAVYDFDRDKRMLFFVMLRQPNADGTVTETWQC